MAEPEGLLMASCSPAINEHLISAEDNLTGIVSIIERMKKDPDEEPVSEEELTALQTLAQKALDEVKIVWDVVDRTSVEAR